MITNIDPSKHLCKIWVPHTEKSTYRTSKEFQAVLKTCKENRLTPCVFVGGQQPLLPTISSLLEEQNPSQYF